MQVGFSRQFEDRALTEATRARKPEAADVDKLRVDVGWKFWKKGPEEEIEGAGVEFVIKFYNAQVCSHTMHPHIGMPCQACMWQPHFTTHRYTRQRCMHSCIECIGTPVHCT